VLRKLDLDKTYQYLLIVLAFLMPLTVSGANTIIVIICFMWLLSGDYKLKFNQIINSKLMIASILFYFLHIIGMIWTEDINWGLHILHKMWYFLLLFPILFTIVKKEFIKYYISAFLLAIALTEVASYLVWFEIVEPFKNATVENPTPFMSHISYNPILAFTIYIVLHEIFFNKKLTNLLFSFYSFFAISMIINMFITGGRAGQVVFFVMLAIIIFQILEKQRIKSFIAILIVIPGIFLTAYQVSDLFQERVDLAVKEIDTYTDKNYSSVGIRINFAVNSWQVIKKNPLIGVGTGDFPNEYKKINEINSPGLVDGVADATNPHNMYTLVLMQLGFLGLFSMLSIFYYQIKISFNSSNKLIRDLGVTLPLLFLVLMWSDSYLLGHYTTLMYVFFSSFLYKDFEKT
jgi:O-antigen ligase